jgi:hypothetical protein
VYKNKAGLDALSTGALQKSHLALSQNEWLEISANFYEW